MNRYLAACALAASSMVPPLAAQAPGGGAGGGAATVVRAVRAAGPVRVDGRLDDAAWAASVPITGFRQVAPQEGAPATQQTEARFLFDDDALYVGVRMHDSGRVTGRLGRRDLSGDDSDWIGVGLDSDHDHQNAYVLDVNPAGVQRDGIMVVDQFDIAWDGVWEAKTTVDSAGWTAEYRIPLGQLRFDPGAGVWGVQLFRVVGRSRERSVAEFTHSSLPGGIPRYAHLEGISGVSGGRRLELLPYAVARSERIDPGANPYRTASEYRSSVGADVRYRLTSGLTLNATVNPDFGQVEADPAEVNLSAFETQLTERRPFFVEGADIFDFGRGAIAAGPANRRLFYSRRIGRAPQLGSRGATADVPPTSAILGAVKLSGRPAPGWSLGMLGAVTAQEEVRWRDADGTDRRATAEPLTRYFMGRVLRELRDGQTRFGGAVTGLGRRLDDDASAQLRSSAYVGGLDFSHEFAGRGWRVSGYTAASRVEGSREAILATQRSPARFLQRPDAGHLALDPDATSLAGWTGQLQLVKQAGTHWRGDMFLTATSPGYEINDVGFQLRADSRGGGGRVQYVENRPGPLFRTYQVEGSSYWFFNGGGDRVGNSQSVSSQLELLNYSRLNLSLGYSLGNRGNDRLTRGGPAMYFPTERRAAAEFNSDSRRALRVGTGASIRDNGPYGRESSLFGRLVVQPSPRWNLSVGPHLYRVSITGQYVAQVADTLATGTFGRRYVFADLDQSTLGVETRLNYTFTPTLSLQVYAQPFLSAGDFGRYKELTAARTFDFAVYGEDRGTIRPREGGGFRVDPDGAGPAGEFTVGRQFGESDFNIRSLRGNAVLRWEWRPGSTLFLAWQQNRSDRVLDTGDFSFRRDGAALLDAAPDNVFVLKASYWLNR